MQNARMNATAIAAVSGTSSCRFALRLVVSMLLTVFDAWVVVRCSAVAVQSSKFHALLAMIFIVLGIGLASSLAHVWYLMFRSRNPR